jgi:hypothetical protein
MKLQLATLVLLLASAGAVHAQNVTATASIPFSFSVQGHNMTAGYYTISQNFASHILMVRSTDAKEAVTTLLTEMDEAKAEGSPTLVFHRYGDRYFLAQIVVPGRYCSALPKTDIERELSARAGEPTETILIAMR